MLKVLKKKIDQLKLLDVQKLATDALYAKQRLFVHKDKPGRLLAHLLAKDTCHRTISKTIKDDDTMTDSVEEKLDIFF